MADESNFRQLVAILSSVPTESPQPIEQTQEKQIHVTGSNNLVIGHIGSIQVNIGSNR